MCNPGFSPAFQPRFMGEETADMTGPVQAPPSRRMATGRYATAPEEPPLLTGFRLVPGAAVG